MDSENSNIKEANKKEGETLDMKVILKLSIFLFLIAATLIVNIYLRSGLLKYNGFFEPDAFMYYTGIQAAIANNFAVPALTTLSGFPAHNPIAESRGIYYATLIPYLFLKFFGISAYTIMRLVPILFGIFDAIAAYFLAKELFDNKYLGLMAMFFVSISGGNIARTAGAVYRGDTFVTIFAILALLFMIRTLKSNKNKRLINATLAGIFVGSAAFAWSGASYVVAIFILALVMEIIYGFIKGDKEFAFGSLLLTFSLFLGFIINSILFATKLAPVETLSGLNYIIVLYIPVLLAALLSWVILSKKINLKFTEKTINRIGFAILIIFVGGIVLYLGFGHYIGFVTSGGGNLAKNNVSNTTQELQPPTLSFLLSSFGYTIYAIPFGIGLFILYLYMNKGKEWIGGGIAAFIAVISYLAVTGYLQSIAIRFNSLFSIPVAIFSALALFVIGNIAYEFYLKNANKITYKAIFAVVAIIIVIFVFLNFLYFGLPNASDYYQADGINPQFLQAASWIKTNTPVNSTFITLWPDGSVIEGWGNRASYMDSVFGENSTRILHFNNFLFNTTDNPNYFYSINKPEYLFVRSYWFNELPGIGIEGNLTTAQLQQYTYFTFTNASTSSTSNSLTYYFVSNQPPYYSGKLVIENTNGINQGQAFIGQNGNQYTPIKSVIFYNITLGANNNTMGTSYTMFNSTGNALNYTIMVSSYQNKIVGASVLSDTLLNSNLFKFLILCNQYTCPYNNSKVGLKLVYANQDSKIFKIIYNNTS